MPDCTRCRCPLADPKWLEHPSLEHCVKALGKKVNPDPVPEPPRFAGWPTGATLTVSSSERRRGASALEQLRAEGWKDVTDDVYETLGLGKEWDEAKQARDAEYERRLRMYEGATHLGSACGACGRRVTEAGCGCG